MTEQWKEFFLALFYSVVSPEWLVLRREKKEQSREFQRALRFWCQDSGCVMWKRL